MNLNRVDNAIYQHFLEKFDANVKRFGYQNMQHEIQDLKYSEDQYSKDCDSLNLQFVSNISEISTMSGQEMDCSFATGKIAGYLMNEWLIKRQST